MLALLPLNGEALLSTDKNKVNHTKKTKLYSNEKSIISNYQHLYAQFMH